MTYALGFVGLISLVIMAVGIKQRKRADIVTGSLTIVLCLLLFFLEYH